MLQVASESSETRVYCLTNHLTSFAGQFYVVPNSIDFHHVSNEITPLPPENLFVLCTVFLMFAFYFVGLLFARKADIRDKMKVTCLKMFRFITLQISLGSYIQLAYRSIAALKRTKCVQPQRKSFLLLDQFSLSLFLLQQICFVEKRNKTEV